MGIKVESGKVIVDEFISTNVEGVYGAGDVADKPFKQAITGVAEGCTAAHSAWEFIQQFFKELKLSK